VAEGPIDAILLTASTVVYGAARMFVDGHFAMMGIGPERAEWVAQTVTGMLGVGFATEAARGVKGTKTAKGAGTGPGRRAKKKTK
jgi:hypothetical protein